MALWSVGGSHDGNHPAHLGDLDGLDCSEGQHLAHPGTRKLTIDLVVRVLHEHLTTDNTEILIFNEVEL